MNKLKQKAASSVNAVIALVPTLVFLGLLCYLFASSMLNDMIRGRITNVTMDAYSVISVTNEMEGILQENIEDKGEYINLNGLVTRILGINTLNERIRLANGSIAAQEGLGNVSGYAENVAKLRDFLEARGIEFLYALAPSKTNVYDCEFLPGYSDEDWKNASAMLSLLEEAQIETIDLNASYQARNMKSEEIFFTTDHHWVPGAALVAAQETMRYLSEHGYAQYQEELLREESYDITVLEDCFLGSDGRRTGALYAGMDDFSIYTPKFSTGYSFSGLMRGDTSWGYWDTIVDESYLVPGEDHFYDDHYSYYMRGDLPLRRTFNSEAVNDQRVLILGDSYKTIYEYFLSTQFQEVYTTDLRYYKEGSFAQLVAQIQPEIVLMCINSTTHPTLYQFGTEDYLAALETTDRSQSPVDLGTVTLTGEVEDPDLGVPGNQNKFSVLCSDLKPGSTYTLTVAKAALEGTHGKHVQLSLQNLSQGETVCNGYFETDRTEPQRWIFTVPEGSTDNFALYLHAGVKGSTSGVTAAVSDMCLYEGVVEN